jgi:hypothetical protein
MAGQPDRRLLIYDKHFKLQKAIKQANIWRRTPPQFEQQHTAERIDNALD